VAGFWAFLIASLAAPGSILVPAWSPPPSGVAAARGPANPFVDRYNVSRVHSAREASPVLAAVEQLDQQMHRLLVLLLDALWFGLAVVIDPLLPIQNLTAAMDAFLTLRALNWQASILHARMLRDEWRFLTTWTSVLRSTDTCRVPGEEAWFHDRLAPYLRGQAELGPPESGAGVCGWDRGLERELGVWFERGRIAVRRLGAANGPLAKTWCVGQYCL
jgi:hypothetical protein